MIQVTLSQEELRLVFRALGVYANILSLTPLNPKDEDNHTRYLQKQIGVCLTEYQEGLEAQMEILRKEAGKKSKPKTKKKKQQ